MGPGRATTISRDNPLYGKKASLCGRGKKALKKMRKEGAFCGIALQVIMHVLKIKREKRIRRIDK